MLSVVIPTYNEEDFLPALLASLARQSVRDVEIIVADAQSTDKTRAIAKKHGCTVVEGGLPAVGRNNGAAVAHGELLLFLDADVLLPGEDFLAGVLKEFTERHLDISTSLIRPMSSSSLDTLFYVFYNSYIYATQKFFPHAHGFFIIVRKEMHERIGGFDVRVQLAEDHDYAQRAAKAGATFGVLMNEKLPVSTRRFLRDGHFRTAAKYVLCELHMLTLGSVKSDIFRYRFGYAKGLARKRP
ncbi:glycosyltransferase [Patescibacteria group bacterium]|nr:glycosyltransferase [Patescibacteria group bacterium]